MSTEILMPALSPTMEEGGIAKWLVKEGDIIKAGDLIAEIETDKAIMEFESALDCKISKLLVEEGTNNIKVNTPIVKINDNHIPLPTKNLNKENKILYFFLYLDPFKKFFFEGNFFNFTSLVYFFTAFSIILFKFTYFFTNLG